MNCVLPENKQKANIYEWDDFVLNKDTQIYSELVYVYDPINGSLTPLFKYPGFECPVYTKYAEYCTRRFVHMPDSLKNSISKNLVIINTDDKDIVYVQTKVDKIYNGDKDIDALVERMLYSYHGYTLNEMYSIAYGNLDYEVLLKLNYPEDEIDVNDYYKYAIKTKGVTMKNQEPKTNTVKTTINVTSTTTTPKTIETQKKTVEAEVLRSMHSKKDALRKMVLSSKKSKSVLYTKGAEFKSLIPEENGTTIVFAKNGIFEIVKTRFGIFNVKSQSLNIPQRDLLDFNMKDQWFIPKPTIADLIRLVELDKYVYKKTNAEFYANLMWNTQTQKYEIEIPEQKISGAHVEFKPIVDTDEKFTVIDHHSHNVMSSFFSGTDDNNDMVRFKLAIVVGNIDKGFTVAARKVVNGIFEKVDYKEFFQDEELDNLITQVDKMFSENKITTRTYETYGTSYTKTTNVYGTTATSVRTPNQSVKSDADLRNLFNTNNNKPKKLF